MIKRAVLGIQLSLDTGVMSFVPNEEVEVNAQDVYNVNFKYKNNEMYLISKGEVSWIFGSEPSLKKVSGVVAKMINRLTDRLIEGTSKKGSEEYQQLRQEVMERCDEEGISRFKGQEYMEKMCKISDFQEMKKIVGEFFGRVLE